MWIVDLPSGKSVTQWVFDKHNIEATWVTFSVCDNSDTTQIVASGDHAEVTCLELDEF